MQELTEAIIKKLSKAPVTFANGNNGVSVKDGKYEWRLEYDAHEKDTFLARWIGGYGSDVEIPESLQPVARMLEAL